VHGGLLLLRSCLSRLQVLVQLCSAGCNAASVQWPGLSTRVHSCQAVLEILPLVVEPLIDVLEGLKGSGGLATGSDLERDNADDARGMLTSVEVFKPV
jgi:hypothetical protein